MKYGEVEELNMCENLGDHMVGNVYAKYYDEEHADAALKALFGRFYAGRPLVCEFSPVTDFREARCKKKWRKAREKRERQERGESVSSSDDGKGSRSRSRDKGKEKDRSRSRSRDKKDEPEK